MKTIAILVEHRQGAIRDVTFEMLAAARALAASAGGTTEAYLLSDSDALAAGLAGQADVVVCASAPALAQFNAERYQRVLVGLIGERKPDLVMTAHTAFGTDVAPSLAVELGIGLVSDAAGLELTPEGLKVTRGMYGSKLNAERLVTTNPALVMVRQAQFKPEPASLGAEKVHWDAAAAMGEGFRTKFISLEEIPVTGIDITKADIIVSIGRGLKEAANLAPVQELASALGGVLAGSRPVVDAGWLPKDCQVGSSGKTVKPKVYIALGISGSFQHVAGMKGADTIVAVNKDPNAPIFSVAHYGIVDDLNKVVPALKTKLAEMKS